ncbi:MAG: stage III sporulation protein AF [Clostridiales bacterium]|jgi:stage III sporulation protein AF|nr:stage III sporulation protein AF [Clostridiales bacterium]
MEFIKGWTVAIAGLVILSAILDTLIPSGGMKKYVNLAFGFIIIAVIIKPVANLKSMEIWQNSFQIEYNQGVVESTAAERIKSAFAEKVAADIETRLSKNYGTVEADVEVTSSVDGTLVLESITIKNVPERLRKDVKNELKENYGCDEIRFN